MGPLSFSGDRNAENFRRYFADQGKKVWTQGKGGTFKTPHILVTPGCGAGPEGRVSSGSPACLLAWAQRPLVKVVVVYQTIDLASVTPPDLPVNQTPTWPPAGCCELNTVMDSWRQGAGGRRMRKQDLTIHRGLEITHREVQSFCSWCSGQILQGHDHPNTHSGMRWVNWALPLHALES